jgi:hypothetical protein
VSLKPAISSQWMRAQPDETKWRKEEFYHYCMHIRPIALGDRFILYVRLITVSCVEYL